MENKTVVESQEVSEKTSQEKFCEKCGAKIAAGTEVCPNCGCPTEQEPSQPTSAKRKALSKKQIILIVVSAVVLVAVAIAGFFLWQYIRVERVKEQLAGETFYYSDLAYSFYQEKSYTFDDIAACRYYSYYSYRNQDEPTEFEFPIYYEIKFEDGMVFLETSARKLEIQYDKYGNIDGLYNIDEKEFYD